MVIGAVGGVTWRASRELVPVQWTGTRLGGPAIALYPRVSPDSQLLAFQAMVDGLTQVAVMKPGTGNWTVLTHDRTKGLADALAWSSDGARIYFDRWTDVPMGIFSVPALGGDERLLIENASAPEPLPDGSLLLQRINADRVPQLHRFWPDTGKLEPLPVITFRAGYAGPVRRLDAGVLDLRTGKLQKLALDYFTVDIQDLGSRFAEFRKLELRFSRFVDDRVAPAIRREFELETRGSI